MRKRVKQYLFLITRDYEEDAGSVDDLLMELRDSTIVPLLLNPFQVFLTTMHLGESRQKFSFSNSQMWICKATLIIANFSNQVYFFALLSTLPKKSSGKLF